VHVMVCPPVPYADLMFAMCYALQVPS
jgi:hypothetical protein